MLSSATASTSSSSSFCPSSSPSFVPLYTCHDVSWSLSKSSSRSFAAGEAAVATSADALADEYLAGISARRFIAGSQKMLDLLKLCEDRSALEKAVQALRLSRGLMTNRKQFKPYNIAVTNEIIKQCLNMKAPDLLLDLIKEKNSLGLRFSKKKLRNLLQTYFTSKKNLAILEENDRVSDIYDVMIVQPHQESEISFSIVKIFFKKLVYNGGEKTDVMAFADDIENRFEIDGKSLVETYQKLKVEHSGGEEAEAVDEEKVSSEGTTDEIEGQEDSIGETVEDAKQEDEGDKGSNEKA